VGLDSRQNAIERITRRMFTRIISSLSRTLQEEELSVAQVATLYLLDEHGTMRIGDVGNALDRAAPATSRMIDDLVASGLVERKEDPSDRRARVLSLTSKGSKFIARAGEARVKTILEGVRELPEQATELFLSTVGKRK
jgi:DNA-binding MarR family transcriptional regulator